VNELWLENEHRPTGPQLAGAKQPSLSFGYLCLMVNLRKIPIALKTRKRVGWRVAQIEDARFGWETLSIRAVESLPRASAGWSSNYNKLCDLLLR
jgi:hypothetical protein